MLHKLVRLVLVVIIGSLLVVGVQAQETISFGQQAEGSLSSATPQIVYTFTGEKGQSLIISMVSEEFDSYLELADAEGNLITSDDDGGGYPNAQIGPWLLTDSGEYQIIAKSIDSSAKGSFVLSLNSATVNVLNYDEPLDTEMTEETQVLYFQFDGKAGEIINLSVDSGGMLDTWVTILDTADVQVTMDDDSGEGSDPFVSNFVIPYDDVYLVVLEPYSVGSAGKIQVKLWKSEIPSLDDGPQTVMLAEETYRQVLAFEGKAGESVQIKLQFVDGASDTMTASLSQGGEDIAYINGYNLDNLSFGAKTPVNGQVFLALESSFFMTDSGASNVEVTLERLPAAQ